MLSKYYIQLPAVKNDSKTVHPFLFWQGFSEDIVSKFEWQQNKMWKKAKSHKIYKLSKPNIFFARFEGTRGEKTQVFRTTVTLNTSRNPSASNQQFEQM